MLSRYPDVSVLLVGENLSAYLPTWFIHLELQEFPLSQMEWIIIDVGSTQKVDDQIHSLIKGSPLKVRYIHDSSNSEIEAWNLGFREAEGKWILCSQFDVLPSSNWVQRHVHIQRINNDKACVSGSLIPHPRLSSRSITRWFLPEDVLFPIPKPIKPTPFHFSLANMSFPKEMILHIGGLNKFFSFPDFSEVELAQRLQDADVPLQIDEQALCWIWTGSSYFNICKYHYRRGYSMGCFMRIFPNSYEVIEHYRLYQPLYTRIFNSLVVPYYHQICKKFPEDSRTLNYAYRRVFRYFRHRGFQDAINREEPQIDIISP
ncbi:MAG TPA: glycosyltransferase [Candidatus Hydrogenedens sp.]|nr:glycosyltransferase [Candidatus Hydrogenedens sp.]HOK09496.1 glycosyltransferase [Candidatus Hydrogenedens sp.]HOL20207.1 glycosyltransferase [Candidatus Hydrogenedens sp.]HPP59205.1 glycosyltransferase [Candidatus Hydrogenedens sp.]